MVSALTGHCRHLHPAEGALLCTVPLGYHFPMPVRSALSRLGQIAAPMQVLWVQAQIVAGLQIHFWGSTGLDPMTCIQVLQDQLTRQPFENGPRCQCTSQDKSTCRLKARMQSLQSLVSHPFQHLSLRLPRKNYVDGDKGIRLSPDNCCAQGSFTPLYCARARKLFPCQFPSKAVAISVRVGASMTR